MLAEPPGPRGEVGSPRREITPVWDMVEAAIRAQAAYAPSFFILLTLAGVIAAVGPLTNSRILIVAAMVVGTEYSAIIWPAGARLAMGFGCATDGRAGEEPSG